MPIYAYRCDACGFRKDVLQKMSDLALSTCPSCSAESFIKQLSAPAFQLKGTGWYVTDFRDKGKTGDGADAGKTVPAGEAGASGNDGAKNGSRDGKTDDKKADQPADKKTDSAPAGGTAAPASGTPAPAAKPSAGATKSANTTGSTSSPGGGTSAS
jgi:putative FmdB family regulatory protein